MTTCQIDIFSRIANNDAMLGWWSDGFFSVVAANASTSTSTIGVSFGLHRISS